MLDNWRELVAGVAGARVARSRCSGARLEAGGAILTAAREGWASLHAEAARAAEAATVADALVARLHGAVKARRQHAVDLTQSLSTLPRLTEAVDECVESIQDLERLLATVENELTDLEDLVDRHEMARRKIDHHFHMGLFKEKKLAGLEVTRAQLAQQSSDNHKERERKHLESLRGRSDACAEAFTQDVAQYLATGAVPPKIPLTTTGLTLEQVQLDDVNSDALDEFLNS